MGTHMHVFSFPRGFCVGIYATNFADACEYVINHAKVNILLVENNAQLQKILSVTTAPPTPAPRPTPPPPITKEHWMCAEWRSLTSKAYSFPTWSPFFLMWTIFKVFIEFVTILLVFYVLVLFG